MSPYLAVIGRERNRARHQQDKRYNLVVATTRQILGGGEWKAAGAPIVSHGIVVTPGDSGVSPSKTRKSKSKGKVPKPAQALLPVVVGSWCGQAKPKRRPHESE